VPERSTGGRTARPRPGSEPLDQPYDLAQAQDAKPSSLATVGCWAGSGGTDQPPQRSVKVTAQGRASGIR
jgi:hypothetical protein